MKQNYIKSFLFTTNMNSFKEIYDVLSKEKEFLLSLHSNPDGDSLGSCLAMKYFLERDFNAKVKLVSFDDLSKSIERLDYNKEVLFKEDIEDHLTKDTFLIVLDCGAASRIGKMKKGYKIPNHIKSLNIDHHETNENFATYNFVNKEASSTCSILLDMFKELKVVIDRELARRLMIGIVTDTNHFKALKGSIKSMKDIIFLEENGGNFEQDILNEYTYKTDVNIKKYQGKILKNLEVNKELKLAISVVSEEDIEKLDLNISDIRSGINELTGIKDTDYAVLLVVTKDFVKGSIRSFNNKDISKIAQKLNGGGHKQRAGFYCEKPLEEIKKILYEELRNLNTNI